MIISWIFHIPYIFLKITGRLDFVCWNKMSTFFNTRMMKYWNAYAFQLVTLYRILVLVLMVNRKLMHSCRQLELAKRNTSTNLTHVNTWLLNNMSWNRTTNSHLMKRIWQVMKASLINSFLLHRIPRILSQKKICSLFQREP